jgi:PAS domain S-box-containing protein
MELLEKAAKLETAFNARKDIHLNYSSDLNIEGQEDGILFMTMEEERLAQITTCNLSCSSMLGYAKTELLNRNVNVLMPYVFSKNHDEILKRYLQTSENFFANKDRQVYAKNKTGYVF